MAYTTVDDIRAASTRLSAIKEADDGEINLWIDEAYDIINSFCSQDFSLEINATKTINVNHPLVFLPKPLSGTVVLSVGGVDVGTTDYQFVEGATSFRYAPLNYYYSDSVRTLEPVLMSVTGTWGYAPSEDYLVIAIANDLKSKYSSHISSVSFHLAADTTNVVTSPNATNLATAITLLNELRTDMIAHFANVVSHSSTDSGVPAVSTATDITTALALAGDLVSKFNDHIARVPIHVTADTNNTSDWTINVPVLPRVVKRAFIRVVQRLALRADEEDQYQMNSGYSSETTGDGYSYNLSDGTLRNLLRPEEREMLWPYIRRGRMLI